MTREPSGILVPAYVYPGDGVWKPLISVASYTRPDRLMIIANPDNGPGYDPATMIYRAPDMKYVESIAALRSVCAAVIGYVHDCYGDTNPPSASNCPRRTKIEDDIERWFEAYDVDGIFIDQASHTDLPRGEWLTSIVQDQKADALIVFNPGTLPSREFMAATDPATVVVQEQTFIHYTNWPPAGWVRDRANGDLSIAARRLAIIAHTPQHGDADVNLLIEIAQRYSIGAVYAHDANGPNYNTFSTFLLSIGKHVCRLQSRFGLPCRVYTRPLCLASQLFKLARSARSLVRPNH
jgi:hypothetical protein